MDNALSRIADIVVTKSVNECRNCGPVNATWKPCEYHKGFMGGIVRFVNQMNAELESVGYRG